MPKEPDHVCHSMEYPKELSGRCDPQELLSFLQLEPYTASFIALELQDGEQRAIEIGLMMHPTLHPVIEGTGGIREFHISTPTNSHGSLHLTVYYAYFPEPGSIALIDVWHTPDIGVITLEERKELKELFEEIQEYDW